MRVSGGRVLLCHPVRTMQKLLFLRDMHQKDPQQATSARAPGADVRSRGVCGVYGVLGKRGNDAGHCCRNTVVIVSPLSLTLMTLRTIRWHCTQSSMCKCNLSASWTRANESSWYSNSTSTGEHSQGHSRSPLNYVIISQHIAQ